MLGATGTSGRIATQLARCQGARVVTAGRNQRVLDQLLARGAVDPVPLAKVEQPWPQAGSDRRVVFVSLTARRPGSR